MLLVFVLALQRFLLLLVAFEKQLHVQPLLFELLLGHEVVLSYYLILQGFVFFRAHGYLRMGARWKVRLSRQLLGL